MTIKLFTIPYSGSSAAIYLKWRTLLPENIEVVPLEFPGRGKRFGSKLCDSMEELIDDLVQHIGSQLQGSPYALYGHSLGGLAAYELSVRLLESGQALPVHVFLSGCNPRTCVMERSNCINCPTSYSFKKFSSWAVLLRNWLIIQS